MAELSGPPQNPAIAQPELPGACLEVLSLEDVQVDQATPRLESTHPLLLGPPAQRSRLATAAKPIIPLGGQGWHYIVLSVSAALLPGMFTKIARGVI